MGVQSEITQISPIMKVLLLLLAISGVAVSKPTGGIYHAKEANTEGRSLSLDVDVRGMIDSAADSLGSIDVQTVADSAVKGTVRAKEALAGALDAVGEFDVKEVISTVAQSAVDSVTNLDVKGMVDSAAKDLGHIAQAKGDIIKYSSEALSEAAVAAKDATVGYVSEIDALKALDEAEESVIKQKTAMIQSVFGAKRKMVEGLKKAREQHKENLMYVVDKTLSGVNAAIDTTADGLTVTKEVVSDYAEEITIENAKSVMQC